MDKHTVGHVFLGVQDTTTMAKKNLIKSVEKWYEVAKRATTLAPSQSTSSGRMTEQQGKDVHVFLKRAVAVT